MKTCFAAVVVCVGLALVTPTGLWAGTPLDEGTRPDNALLAHRIVQQCAGVREGDQVLINGGVRDLEHRRRRQLRFLRGTAVHIPGGPMPRQRQLSGKKISFLLLCRFYFSHYR